MNLSDGLLEYQRDTTFWQFTLDLEKQGQGIKEFISQFGENPTQQALSDAKDFLLNVEKWKAMCLKERMVNAIRNKDTAIWSAFLKSVQVGKEDLDALLAIMSLTGFGSSVNEETNLRRAKLATAVMRFLDPQRWGVVDWRNIAVLSILEKQCNWNFDEFLHCSNKWSAQILREHLDEINEEMAISCVQQYRTMTTTHLHRAADIDMALFGLSLLAWPIPG